MSFSVAWKALKDATRMAREKQREKWNAYLDRQKHARSLFQPRSSKPIPKRTLRQWSDPLQPGMAWTSFRRQAFRRATRRLVA